MHRKIEFYETESGNMPVKKFLAKQDVNVQAKIAAAFDFVQNNEVVPSDILKKMKGRKNLWEIRARENKNIFRILCFKDGETLVVAAHGFQKKTRKTPLLEINTAEKRMKEYFRRQK